jgi:hypothetical protein
MTPTRSVMPRWSAILMFAFVRAYVGRLVISALSL